MSHESKLPLDKLPEFWKDESRLNVLYGPFRNKQVNAKDFETKLEFWRKSIQIYCSHNKIYSIKLCLLQTAFTYNGRSPACLTVVLEEMLKDKQIVPLDVFLTKQANTWAGWATETFVKKPMLWSLNKVRTSFFKNNVDEDNFVMIEVIKSDSKDLIATLPDNYKDKVVEIKELMHAIQIDNLENFQLLLHYMQQVGDVASREVNREKNAIILIKFETGKNRTGITDEDVDIYMLGQTEKILIQNIENLENDVIALTNDAKNHLKKGHKQLAKTCLRKKHDIERRIEARANALYNVQTLQSRVEDSKHDVNVVNSYKHALDSLRNNFNSNKLNEDSVTNTMIEIGEVLDIHNDIQTTLAQALNESDADLEAELEELLASDGDVTPKPSDSSPKPTQPKDEEIKKLIREIDELNLPDVPTTDPTLATSVLL